MTNKTEGRKGTTQDRIFEGRKWSIQPSFVVYFQSFSAFSQSTFGSILPSVIFYCTFSHSTFSHFLPTVILPSVILCSVILRSVFLPSVILRSVILRSVTISYLVLGRNISDGHHTSSTISKIVNGHPTWPQ
jgi:hypothetical protein